MAAHPSVVLHSLLLKLRLLDLCMLYTFFFNFMAADGLVSSAFLLLCNVISASLCSQLPYRGLSATFCNSGIYQDQMSWESSVDTNSGGCDVNIASC